MISVIGQETKRYRPMVFEFQALSAAGRRLHWVHCVQVPDIVFKTALLTGRQVKDTDGVWKSIAGSMSHGKVPSTYITPIQPYRNNRCGHTYDNCQHTLH